MSSLEIGSPAPDFTLATDSEGSVTLSALKGKKVVIYFYPKDDTPGCTIEAKEFRDLMPEFEKQNTVIIGISKDDVKSHDKFKQKFCLPFILASDEDTTVCQQYGVWVEKSMYGKKYMGIQRDTFLIDSNGNVAMMWEKVKPEGHAEAVLAAVAKIM